jgi:cytochrome c biogenesis protein
MERIGLKSLRIGESYQFGEVGSITFNGVIPWVNLQIVKDPGKPFALVGSLIGILGLLVSFYVKNQRVWIRHVNRKLFVLARVNKMTAKIEIK